MNENYHFVETILGKEYAEIVKKRYHVVRGTETYGDLFLEGKKGAYYDTDYVRIKFFEFVVKEIRKRKIESAVAEVGVFRGEFANTLIEHFPIALAICLIPLRGLMQMRHFYPRLQWRHNIFTRSQQQPPRRGKSCRSI